MIKGALIDLSGTVHMGEAAIPGAAEAVRRLRERRCPSGSSPTPPVRPEKCCMKISSAWASTSPRSTSSRRPSAVRRYLERHRLRPYLLVHPNLLPEFDGLSLSDPDAVGRRLRQGCLHL